MLTFCFDYFHGLILTKYVFKKKIENKLKLDGVILNE